MNTKTVWLTYTSSYQMNSMRNPLSLSYPLFVYRMQPKSLFRFRQSFRLRIYNRKKSLYSFVRLGKRITANNINSQTMNKVGEEGGGCQPDE